MGLVVEPRQLPGDRAVAVGVGAVAPLGDGGVLGAEPGALPARFLVHRQPAEHRLHDHPTVRGHDHGSARVALDQPVDAGRDPVGHLAPGLTARVAPRVGVPAAGRVRVEPVVVVPRQAVAFARVVLAQVAVLQDVGTAEGRGQDLGGLDRAGHHAGVQRHDLTQLARRLPTVAQRLNLEPARGRQPAAPLVAADDTELLRPRLAVPHEHDPGPVHCSPLLAFGRAARASLTLSPDGAFAPRRRRLQAPGRGTAAPQGGGPGIRDGVSADQKSSMPPPGIAGAFCSSGLSAMTASVVRNRAAIDAAFCSAERVTLAASMMPALVRSSYSSVAALRPSDTPSSARTRSVTTPPSCPALMAICLSGSSSDRATMRAPVASSAARLLAISLTLIWARRRVTPPPATTPSSMAALVVETASSMRCFFSLSSTSVAAPTLSTATPPDSLARRSCSFSRSKSLVVSSIWSLICDLRASMAPDSPLPSTMVVASLVA